MKKMKRPLRVILARVLLLAIAGGALELAARAGLVNELEVLPLSKMVNGAFLIASSGDLWPHLFASGASIGIAFLIAVVLGAAIGYALWRWPPGYRALSPFLVSYYALPIFAFYPILIVVFGANRRPIVFIAAAWAIVAVIVSTVEGLAHVKQSWEKVGTVYHLTWWQRAVSIHFPAALPQIAVGIKLAVTYSILGVIASEFILAGEGLGHLVSAYFNGFRLQEMWGAILTVFAVGITLNLLAGFAVRKWVSAQ